MDAFEFCKEFGRMCEKYSADPKNPCSNCPLFEWDDGRCNRFRVVPNDKIKERIEIVAKWSREHPVKTMAMDFFEKHPNAYKTCYGNPAACANICGYRNNEYCNKSDCLDCWNRPLEE